MEQNRKYSLHSLNLLAVCLALQLTLYKYHSQITATAGQLITEVGVSGKSTAFAFASAFVRVGFAVLVFFIPARIFLSIHRGEEKRYIRLSPTLPLNPVYIIAFSVSVCLLTLVALDRIALYFPVVSDTPVYMPDSSGALLVQFAVAVLVPAFCGEIFFRGIVMHELLPWGRGFAVAAAAFCGALFADSMVKFLLYLVMGLMVGYFVVNSDSLWLGIFSSLACHTTVYLYNFAVSRGLYSQFPSEVQIGLAAVFVAGVFSCLRIDDQISGVSGMREERRAMLSDLVGAPCVIAYFIIVLVNL